MIQEALLASLRDRFRVPPSFGRFARHRRGRCRLVVTPLAAALLSASGLAAPRAEATTGSVLDAKTLALTYEVYAGGLHAFTFMVDLKLEPSGYRIAAGGATRGFIGALYKWNVSLTSEGRDADPARAAKGEGLRPERYVTVNSGRQEAKTMRLDFQPTGAYSVTRDPVEPPDPSADDDELPASLPQDIFDPLSASLAATRALAESGRCEQSVPVFDGKRRYDLLIRDMGQGEVIKSDRSAYAGPATLCGFTMKRISGFAPKRRYAAQWDEEKSEPPTLWIARIRDDLPPVPVRFTGAIALGNIIIHLAKIEPGSELASTVPRTLN